MRKAGADMADMKDANARVAAMVAGIAKPKTPRRTGRLAGTVRHNRALASAQVVAGRASAPYPWYVHAGTTDLAARPWISEAATSSEPRWTETYRREVQRIADTIEGV